MIKPIWKCIETNLKRWSFAIAKAVESGMHLEIENTLLLDGKHCKKLKHTEILNHLCVPLWCRHELACAGSLV